MCPAARAGAAVWLPRPLVLEEPASLALFCTGLAPDLGPAPEVMPACCAAFMGVALKAYVVK
ncbi:hypothetical protein V8C86DRAFT_3134159 [Haematococcus lacustris]